jgi:hypothetical protein
VHLYDTHHSEQSLNDGAQQGQGGWLSLAGKGQVSRMPVQTKLGTRVAANRKVIHAPQQQHAIKDALDNIGWVLQRLQCGNVLWRDAVQRS